jgi:hypothetical protein
VKKKLIWLAPLAVVGVALFAALGGWIVELLWNALLPPLFGWPAVTFWQALGLLVLCRILFGGLGCSGTRTSARRRMDRRFEHLTPEERERFRQRVSEHWGAEAPTSGSEV